MTNIGQLGVHIKVEYILGKKMNWKVYVSKVFPLFYVNYLFILFKMS